MVQMTKTEHDILEDETGSIQLIQVVNSFTPLEYSLDSAILVLDNVRLTLLPIHIHHNMFQLSLSCFLSNFGQLELQVILSRLYLTIAKGV